MRRSDAGTGRIAGVAATGKNVRDEILPIGRWITVKPNLKLFPSIKCRVQMADGRWQMYMTNQSPTEYCSNGRGNLCKVHVHLFPDEKKRDSISLACLVHTDHCTPD